MRKIFLLFGCIARGQGLDELTEKLCDNGLCQMSGDILGSGNKTFSNDQSENDKDRKKQRSPDDFDFYSGNILEEVTQPIVPAVINEECTFREYADETIDENFAVFETSSPYANNMNCTEEFKCSQPNHTVHFEIEYYEVEAEFDKFFVNGEVVENYIPTNEWFDSFQTNIHLGFTTDGSVTKHGFRINLKCDITLPIVTNCNFTEYNDGAIFDTGDPYLNKTRTGINV